MGYIRVIHIAIFEDLWIFPCGQSQIIQIPPNRPVAVIENCLSY